MVLACAFSLGEYTAATEHGWISTLVLAFCFASLTEYMHKSLHCKCTFIKS